MSLKSSPMTSLIPVVNSRVLGLSRLRFVVMPVYLCYLLSVLPLSASLQYPLVSSDTSPFDKAFDSLAQENLERWQMPGLAIAVIDHDRTFSKVCCSPSCKCLVSFRSFPPSPAHESFLSLPLAQI